MLRVARRCTVGVLLVTLMLSAAYVRGQAIKQLPANPFVVIKLNNPQAVSKKLAATAERLGVARFAPAFADPLGELTKNLNLGQGWNSAGEIVAGVYEPGQGEGEPRAIILVPVTDFKAFLGNQPNFKEENNVATFNVGGPEGQQFFAVNRNGYAAITPTRELLDQPAAGVAVAGLAAKQLESADITMYANMKVIAAKGLPALQQNRPQLIQNLEQELNRNPQFNKKFVPVVRALVERLLTVAEGALASGQSATFGITLTNTGIQFTSVADFEPNSYAGQILASMKNSQDMTQLAGLPDRKYLAYGGMVFDRKTTQKIFTDFINPIEKELNTVGEDAKGISAMIAAGRNTVGVIDSAAFAYVMPTGAPGTQSAIQEIAVYYGDAKAMAAAQKESMAAMGDVFKSLLPQQGPMTMSFNVQPGTKSVDGAALDHFSLQFKFDEKSPEGAQAQQVISMMYGGTSLNGYLGAVSDNAYVLSFGGDDELLNSVVAAAKKKDNALANHEPTKAVSGQLPQARAGVYYVAVDNIIGLVVKYLNQFGMPVQLRLPPDLPPVGFSFATEGPAMRIDAYIPNDLVDNLVAAAIQMGMQRAGNRPQGGGL